MPGKIVQFDDETFALRRIIWAKRREKRVSADRMASSYCGSFTLDPLPPAATEVQILVDDESGLPIELEAMRWAWRDKSGETPEDEVPG